MLSDSSVTPRRDFLAIARDLEMLSDDDARDISQEASSLNTSVNQLVLQKGLLSAVQVDIVDTLTRPLETIPGYDILEPIGKGGMGVVYRAKQLNLDRIVALKTVLVGQMADPTMLARFEQEAVAVGRLTHPNIVGAYDFGRHEGRLYFVMELVEGEDAGQLIERSGKLAEPVAWGVARQAAAGLAHAAQYGVVHRDIKPENLLLVEPPKGFPLPAGVPMVKIADFGLAFLTGDVETRTRLTSTNAAVGSPHYMSPEQLSDEPIDLRADMYSLGASVYHMITGDPPFVGKSLPQIVTAKLKAGAPSLDTDQLSKPSIRLVQRLMQRDPDARFDDYEPLLDEIDRVLAAIGSGPQGPTLVSPRERETRPVSKLREPAPTLKLSKTATTPVSQARRRVRFSLFGLLFAVALAAGIFFVATSVFLKPKPYVPGKPTLSLGSQVRQLYNGQNLGGLKYSGQWTTTPDGRGSRALSGKDGAVWKTLPDWSNYRLTVFTWLREQATAEVHFGTVADGEEQGSRLVVRVTVDGVQVGRKPSQNGPFVPLGKMVPLEKTDDYSVIRIDKQSTDWFVLFEGKPIAAMPLAPNQSDQFRLLASGGEVWFHELTVQQLAAPTP